MSFYFKGDLDLEKTDSIFAQPCRKFERTTGVSVVKIWKKKRPVNDRECVVLLRRFKLLLLLFANLVVASSPSPVITPSNLPTFLDRWEKCVKNFFRIFFSSPDKIFLEYLFPF
jgi:hypothetical protein